MRRRDGVFGVAAVEQGYHAVAGANVFYAIPYPGDDARGLRARRERQLLRNKILVAAAHGIGVVDPGGADLDQGLPLTWLGTLHVRVPEYLRLAKLLYHYRLHLRHTNPLFRCFTTANPQTISARPQPGSATLPETPLDVGIRRR